MSNVLERHKEISLNISLYVAYKLFSSYLEVAI